MTLATTLGAAVAAGGWYWKARPRPARRPIKIVPTVRAVAPAAQPAPMTPKPAPGRRGRRTVAGDATARYRAACRPARGPGALLFVRTLTRDRQMEAMLFVAPLAAKQNPLPAAEWAGKFSPKMSDLARSAVLNQWLDQDPAAAQAWMNRRLSSAQRAAILGGRK